MNYNSLSNHLSWNRGTKEYRIKTAPEPGGPWTDIAEGTFTDPIPLARNGDQIPLEIIQFDSEVMSRVSEL